MKRNCELNFEQDDECTSPGFDCISMVVAPARSGIAAAAPRGNEIEASADFDWPHDTWPCPPPDAFEAEFEIPGAPRLPTEFS